MTPDWSPFAVAPRGQRGDAPRAVTTPEGIADRLRAAAFAELQAREAFRWGAERFDDAPLALRTAWRGLAAAEDRHLGWLMQRMSELGVDVCGRRVSDQLWHSLVSCGTARDFAIYMASAEERGRKAGARFHEAMRENDPETATLFGRIAEEEIEHIRLSQRFFPADGQIGPA